MTVSTYQGNSSGSVLTAAFYAIVFLAPLILFFKQLYTRHVQHSTSWATELRKRQKAYEEARPRPPRWLDAPPASSSTSLLAPRSFFSRSTSRRKGRGAGGGGGKAHGPVVEDFDPAAQAPRSMLFALPAELRLLVYRAVLGDSHIHCIPLHKRVGYFECTAPGRRAPSPPPPLLKGGRSSRPGARDACACTCDGAVFPSADGSGGNPQLHRRFHAWWNAKTLPSHLRPPPLALLRSCRQAYVEAGALFYSTNTFAVHSIWTPLDMPAVIAPFRLRQLRTLSLGFSFGAHGLVPLMSPISRNEMHAPATDETWVAMWRSLGAHFSGVRDLSVWLEMRSLDLFVQVELAQWARPLLDMVGRSVDSSSGIISGTAACAPQARTGMQLERVRVRLTGWDARFRTRADEIPPLERRLERLLLGIREDEHRDEDEDGRAESR